MTAGTTVDERRHQPDFLTQLRHMAVDETLPLIERLEAAVARLERYVDLLERLRGTDAGEGGVRNG